VLEETIAVAHSNGLLVIKDAKRMDGGDTAERMPRRTSAKFRF